MTHSLRIALAAIFLIIPSVILNAANHPGLKCPIDAKSGKRAAVQTTHIRKKLVKQKHNAVKTPKVKVAKVHKKISITLPKVNLPEVHFPDIHIRLPHKAHKQSLSFRSKSTARATF